MDTGRSEECQANYLAADGKRRCLPYAAAVYVPSVYYSDAKCSIAAYVRPKAAPAAKYLLVPSDSGGEWMRVIPVLGPLTGTLYSTADGSCAPGSVSAVVGTAVNVGAEVGAASFVEVSLATVD
jgi:hypothetical protein